MNVAIIKTKAEQTLVNQFEAVAGALPGSAWVAAARRKAIGNMATSGLPHRRVEEWKYTDLRNVLKEAYKPAVGVEKAKADAAEVAAALGRGFAELGELRVLIRNGRCAGVVGGGALPAGVTFTALSEALASPAEAALGAALAPEVDSAREPIIALNTAYVSDGARLTISAGAKIARPIHLVFLVDAKEPLAVTTRNVVEVGNGAEVTIIESHVNPGGGAVQTNAVTQVSVGDGGSIVHVKVITEGAHALHLGTSLVELGAEASYRAFELTAGVAVARNETILTYRGEDTKADVSGITLGRGKSHVDTTLTIDHAVPHCESRELFKYVLDGEARGIFQGKVIVRPDAQKSDGKQMAQALMLSDSAEFDSKPELEIYADDVICGHGATVAEIDPNLVFYCRSRGIPLEAARALLIDSFVGEALEKIEDDALRAALETVSRDWLKG